MIFSELLKQVLYMFQELNIENLEYSDHDGIVDWKRTIYIYRIINFVYSRSVKK